MSESQDRPQTDNDVGRGSDTLPERLLARLQELQEAREKMQELEARVAEVTADSEAKDTRITKLTNTLEGARQQLVSLREEIDRLETPPNGYGVLLCVHDDETVDVFTSGRRMRVICSPNVETDELQVGQTVRLNEALTVVEANKFSRTGELCTLREVLESDGEGEPRRAVVITHADQDRVVQLANSINLATVKAGDTLLVDTKAEVAFECIPKPEAEQLVLEEVPDISYDDIGGLGLQIERIRDAVELPYLHADLFVKYNLRAPKGILLYGPPGCGKTMIAKAVANSLAKRVQERTGDSNVRAHFLNIKGPELLNKFVGETERHIREVFQRAREKASEGMPVIVFFDEMESLFRTRGSGVSSDIENTIVPQLLTEIDGVEGLENVIVIGASNREDLIDPAVLRPGRLDVKIKVERPDAEAARDIFSKYLTVNLPVHADDLAEFGGDRDMCIKAMIEKVVERMYAEIDDNRFLEVSYANGDKEVMYFKDFNSGAMVENIVARAKKSAIKDELDTGRGGLRIQHLMGAIVDEFAENEDLPNTTNPDDWARISGKKGERIVYIRTLIKGHKDGGGSGSRTIQAPNDNFSGGQYL